MELREYLFKQHMTCAEFAKQLGVNARYLLNVKNKRVRPGKKIAINIEILTGGQVTIEELREKGKEDSFLNVLE